MWIVLALIPVSIVLFQVELLFVMLNVMTQLFMVFQHLDSSVKELLVCQSVKILSYHLMKFVMKVLQTLDVRMIVNQSELDGIVQQEKT